MKTLEEKTQDKAFKDFFEQLKNSDLVTVIDLGDDTYIEDYETVEESERIDRQK